MALDILEKKQIENLIDHLKEVYPNVLNVEMISKIKENVFQSNLQASFLTREITGLLKKDEGNLYTFLEKYGIPVFLEQHNDNQMSSNVSINEQNLSEDQRAMLNFVEMNFPNHKIISGKENMFIIKGNPDTAVEVVSSNGMYQLRAVSDSKDQKDQQIKLDTQNVGFSKNMNLNQKVAGYSLKQLQKITEGMTEEEIAAYLKIHGKNPQQIMMILLSLEEAKNKEKQENIEFTRPKVLVKKKDQKMAAFVNALMLSFLVGAISGIVFFAMLRIILRAVY